MRAAVHAGRKKASAARLFVVSLAWGEKSYYASYWANIPGGFGEKKEVMKWQPRPNEAPPPRHGYQGLMGNEQRIDWAALLPDPARVPVGDCNASTFSDLTPLGERFATRDITPDKKLILRSPNVNMAPLLMALGTRTALDQYAYNRELPEYEGVVKPQFKPLSTVARVGALGEQMLKTGGDSLSEIVVPSRMDKLDLGYGASITYMTPAVAAADAESVVDLYSFNTEKTADLIRGEYAAR